ncbi:MAG: prepilin-type N-terminal cleavage/methylation domain-containing protein [Patescibacteria group bacterium]
MKNASKGFTLIELIVVTAVFLFVVGAAVGIFISIVQHQRIILVKQELSNQVSYALEHMSKALRMAGKDTDGRCLGTEFARYNYLLTIKDISNGVYTGIKFINQSDINETTGQPVCQEFYLDDDYPENPVLKEKKDGIPSAGIALISDKFMINSIRFGINGEDGLLGGLEGADGDNYIQPRVTIYLDVQVKGDDKQPAEKIQTTISQRDLNAQ